MDSANIDRVAKVVADMAELSPEVARQMLEWMVVRDTVALCVFVSLPVLAWVLLACVWRRLRCNVANQASAVCGCIILTLMTGLACIYAASNLYKISIAPNVVVLEQFCRLLK